MYSSVSVDLADVAAAILRSVPTLSLASLQF
jgi:hypothetical protein